MPRPFAVLFFTKANMIQPHHFFFQLELPLVCFLDKAVYLSLEALDKTGTYTVRSAGSNFRSPSYLKVQNNTSSNQPQYFVSFNICISFFLYFVVHFPGGQDLLAQHSNPNASEMNGSIRLASPLSGQPAGATLTITNDHLLPQSPANSGMAGQDSNMNHDQVNLQT